MPSQIIIGALSAIGYSDRRKNCMDTWMKVADKRGIDAVFLHGVDGITEPKREGRQLLLPCPDEYHTLPQKTRWFCRWALEQDGWEYLFKCDDDTAIAIDRLIAYDALGADYIGAEWKPDVNYGSGGAGYLISRAAAKIIAEKLVDLGGAEDLLVGDVLRNAGISLKIEPRFVPWGHMEHRPRPGNDLITAHAVDLPVFKAVVDEL